METNPKHAAPMSVSLSDIRTEAQWANLATTDFSALNRISHHLVVVPVVGMADWGFGRPLDLEETLTAAVLNHACDQLSDEIELLVVPPWRSVAAPYGHTFFGMDAESTETALKELAQSILVSGFQRLLFLNSNPWNEEVIDTAARDLRVANGLEIFCINLAGLGLDLHPDRGRNRKDIQDAASYIYGDRSNEPQLPARDELTWFRPGRYDQPPPLPSDPDLDRAMDRGAQIIARSGNRLASLLREIHDRPALGGLAVGEPVSPDPD